MNAALLGLAYALGFAFFLGYSRGMSNGEGPWGWEEFAVALVWPLGLFWLAQSYWEGLRKSVLVLACVLLAAAAARAQVTVTVSTSGPASALSVVTSTPSGIVCPGACSASFSSSTALTLGEVSASTVAFVGWANVAACRNNAATCVFTPLVDVAVGAAFQPTLTLGVSGTGLGAITGPGGLACDAAAACASGASVQVLLPLGSSVTLTEQEGPNSTFTGWTGAAGCSSASTCAVTMNGSKNVAAAFAAGAGPYQVQVVVPTTPGGVVTSAPAGVVCGDGYTSCTAPFVANTTFTLTAAADPGYYFAGYVAAGASTTTAAAVFTSSSPLMGLGGYWSPAAYFYPNGQ